MKIKNLRNISSINLYLIISALSVVSLFFSLYLLNYKNYNAQANLGGNLNKKYFYKNDILETSNKVNIDDIEKNENYLNRDEDIDEKTEYIERNNLEINKVISKNKTTNYKKETNKKINKNLENNKSSNEILKQDNQAYLLANILSLLINKNNINQKNNSDNIKSNQNDNNQDNRNNNFQNNFNSQNNNQSLNSNFNSQNRNNNNQRNSSQNNNQNNNQINNQNTNQNNNNNQNDSNNNNENNEENDVNLNNTSNNNKILISEILIDGGNRNDEFIELYNPNHFPIDLTGWKLIKFNKNGSSTTLISSRTRNNFNGKIIQPFSYFLIANSDGRFNRLADITYSSSYQLAKDNAIVLINNQNQVVDKVGWGNISVFETQAAQNPQENQSLVRKAGESSTLESLNNIERNFGNSYDSDNNQFDFLISNQPEPQNSSNSQEIPPAAFTLINYSEENNVFNFEIISPYRRLGEGRYVILAFDSSEFPETENEEEIYNFIRSNWRNNILNVNLPEVRFTGKKENIRVDLSNLENIDDKIIILGLLINNNLYFWSPEILNNQTQNE
jgi:hypothetical protein